MGERRRRTAFVHYSAPPVVGGVEAVMHAHAEVLQRHGHAVTVIAGRGDCAALPDGTELVVIPEIDSQHPETLAASQHLEQGSVPETFESLVSRLVDALAPQLETMDAVIVHNVFTKHFNLPLTIALLRLVEQGVIRRCVGWCHDFTWTSTNSRHKVHDGYPWDALRTYRADVAWVAVSDERRQTLAGLFGCPTDAIRVVYNGVDPATLYGLSPAGLALMTRLGWLDAELSLLMPVRVTTAKNIEFALHTVAELKAEGIAPKLVVTGPPDPHEPASMQYFRSLQALRKQLGVVDEMRFVFESGTDPDAPALIPLEVVGELLRTADLMFMPSHREGFGMPVLEAGLSGVPVVSTAIPAAVEIGQNDVVLFDPDEGPTAVAQRILATVEHNPLARFRRRARLQYTWDAIYRGAIAPLLELPNDAR